MSAAEHPPRVLVVGSGWRFTSGISYYTCRLTNALAEAGPTDALLMRHLVPTFLYPGRRRVGQTVHDLEYADGVEVHDGIDWWWGASMRTATRFLNRRDPDVVVLQWWTGAVLHSYLHLARLAKAQGAVVVMEWHEVQDTGEARIPGTAYYVRRLMSRLLDRVDGHVVHSSHDLALLDAAYDLSASGTPVAVVPHGPYDHIRLDAGGSDPAAPAGPRPKVPAAPDNDVREHEPFRLLFFGIIRPYKGLEDLVAAFEAVPVDVNLHLTIVGETWEGWHAPLEAVAASPARGRITVVNRYVSDAEAQQFFASADAVVLPYRRSSSSGPLHLAMSAGLPTVVTDVGGLAEAAAGYEGVTFVPPADVPALATVLAELPSQRGRRFTDARSWEATVDAYGELIHTLIAPSNELDDARLTRSPRTQMSPERTTP